MQSTLQLQLTIKKGKVFANGREIEGAEVKGTLSGAIEFDNKLELIDPLYLSVPKQFAKLHVDLLAVLKDIDRLDAFYNFMMRTDGIRRKSFVEQGNVPFYMVPTIICLLTQHGAVNSNNGLLKKVELFTRFLMHRRDLMIDESVDLQRLKSMDAIQREEEKREKRYIMPSLEELKAMSYEMLTDEIVRAEQLVAKSKIVRQLKEMRQAKKLRSNKTEKDRMMDAIKEDRIEAEEFDHSQTRAAKHHKRKEKIKAKAQRVNAEDADDATYIDGEVNE